MKKLLILAVVIASTALLVWFVDRAGLIYWVGANDLVVEFVVTDVSTGKAIGGAEIHVFSEGGLYEGANKDDEAFILHANDEGIARRECEESMCFGPQSLLRFTDTRWVHLPLWRIKASAPGYESTKDWTFIDTLENRSRVEYQGHSKDRLVVPLTLAKKRRM